MNRTLRIATRRSPLALWQAEFVAEILRRGHPSRTVQLVPMTTRGDQLLDRSLAAIGGKGLFLKELEEAMLAGEAELAVHSMKDMPADLPEGFSIAAVLERHAPHDALVSNRFASLADLPERARVGTSSLRRQAQLLAHRPDLQVHPLRGNVNTRLAKLDAGDYDAIILAAAGLQRLGMGDRITEILTPAQSLPAVAQGAMGIECLSGDDELLALLGQLEDPATRACVDAERAMSFDLGGSCQVPLAGFAELADGQLQLRGLIATPDGQRVLRARAAGATDDPARVGQTVAGDLREQGAAALLEAL